VRRKLFAKLGLTFLALLASAMLAVGLLAERALRLGGNANNPALTRKEAAMLIRGASLVPRERTGAETYVEEPT